MNSVLSGLTELEEEVVWIYEMNLEMVSAGFLQVKASGKGLTASFHQSGMVADFVLFVIGSYRILL